MEEFKEGFEEAVVNMASNPSYQQEYVFYLSVLSQCKVIYDTTLQAMAAVNFQYDHYNLYINPSKVIMEGKDEKGNKVVLQGFSTDVPLSHRIGVLKHEMLHIILNHVGVESRHKLQSYKYHELVNLSMDCALNQLINKAHLPDYAVYPDTFTERYNITVPKNLTWEQYYDLIPQKEKDKEQQKQEALDKLRKEIQEALKNGEIPSIDLNPTDLIDSHAKWEESAGDVIIQKDITKKMLDKAFNEAHKSRGNIPKEYSDWLAIHTNNTEVDWKTLLRSAIGTKRTKVTKSIRKPSRRVEGVKGKVKDYVLSLLTIVDVSGSITNETLLDMLSTVIHLCKVTRTESYLIQVDTHPSKPELLTSKTKTIERKACGGTFLSPALDKAKEEGISYDVVLVLTDGYLSEEDVHFFQKLNKKVIWVIEPKGKVMGVMNSRKMKAVQLKE